MSYHVAVLPGDGIGPEIIDQAMKVLQVFVDRGIQMTFTEAPVGGAAYDVAGDPLPQTTLDLCLKADAVLFGAVGGAQYDVLPRPKRPEQALLGLRSALGLFANLRPAKVFEPLIDSSAMKADIIRGLDIMILRELTGDIYFGKPRAIEVNANGEREGYNTMRYTESEIRRAAHVAFKMAQKRQKRVCSVDKHNVLETMELWREVVTEVGKEYPDVELSHLYVDNTAMQLVRWPKQFDVMLTGNMFGDILSDQAAALTGSIGMLPSASLGEGTRGMYEPIHGSAPDIAGKDLANPLATILSAAMMMRHSFNLDKEAAEIEAAVNQVLAEGYRTKDIETPGCKLVGTKAMGDAVVAALKKA